MKRLRAAGAPWTLVPRVAAMALPAVAAAMASYQLILWVFRHEPVASASALRDTSAVCHSECAYSAFG